MAHYHTFCVVLDLLNVLITLSLLYTALRWLAPRIQPSPCLSNKIKRTSRYPSFASLMGNREGGELFQNCKMIIIEGNNWTI